ncbi:acyl-CoA dehydrogenase [Tomitella fengzijianii]|uniref:Broad-specificity linear acyl-CoA dehydrogenase FadE5 n=1 Tax=Tomitella fengzijianii TaxID=2597660 RepID=A0A516X1B5_9ACTN|nr:acyl-CoA dehydrogenase [Tomitella fengzijianii]QDQ96872.1 acyl-CoA dehydrogenase [Tomitella fengzijianii]
MGHYRSNVRDIEFNLFEVLGIGKILADGAFGDLDPDAVSDILAEAARQAEGPLAASYADADRNPPRFDPADHSVSLPESFKESFRAWRSAGWYRVGMDVELGGVPAPRILVWALNELALGAQPAAYMYLAGPKFAEILHRIGTDRQRRWARIAVEREWGATMALTEPDAGSDVGAGRTRAIRQDDGTWRIEGVKRFITSADADDLCENTVHQVLARPEGAGPGTKGLSLFLVPKFLFDPESGEPGARNGVFVTGIEHKMGLTASATCELSFGMHGTPAVGYLVGDRHAGIAQMFHVIEEARMMVGVKAIATLSTGYLGALDYARTRVQGVDLARMGDKSAPKVTISHHPDVRRSLLMQKSYAEGLRALYLYTAAHQDAAVAARVSGADADMAARVNDLLLPVVKAAGSERAYAMLTETLQCFGGSGFLQDHPVEQYIRDAKIDSLYEGTTAIQAQDFFFRKILRDGGGALAHLAEQVRRTADGGDDGVSRGGDVGADRLAPVRARLAQALGDVQAMTATLGGHAMAAHDDPDRLYKVGLGAVDFLLAVGDLLIAWQLSLQAQIALRLLHADPAEPDRLFYEGKVVAASFFARHVLPGITAAREVIDGLDEEPMHLDEAAF